MKNWFLYTLLGALFFLVGCQAQTEITLKPVDEERAYSETEADAIQTVLEKRLQNLGADVSVTYVFHGNVPYFSIEGSFDSEQSALEIVDKSTKIALLEFVDYAGLDPEILEAASEPDACIITTYQVELGVAEIDENGLPTSSLCENPLIIENGQPFNTVISNEGIATASGYMDIVGQYIISFDLTDSASEIFADHTGANIGQPMAIVVNGHVVSAPRIQQAIEFGVGQISGGFTEEEVETLAMQLNAGTLIIPLEIVEISENTGLSFFE